MAPKDDNGSIPLENVFLDNAEMTVDAKLRVGIPERFMKVLKTLAPEHTDKIGVIPTLDHSLKLMPYPAFMKRVEWWKTLNDRLAAHRTIKNLETSLAKVLALDNQNRIRLTPAQVKFCRIKEEALIVGRIEYMELFAPPTFDETIQREMKEYESASDLVAREEAGIKPVQQFVIEASSRG
ncbi:hypothetical protein HY256_03025 [Candidatus Sumerlaeota bacterium]|nr:hypothetical protein [Candidatus Sumerlaeota bacterium]